MTAAGARVLEQVAQLLADVAVVHVERGDTGAEGPDHALEVLVAVVEGECDVVLARLVAFERHPFDACPEAVAVQVGRQAPRALSDVEIAESPPAVHHAVALAERLRPGVEDRGQVEAHRFVGSTHGGGRVVGHVHRSYRDDAVRARGRDADMQRASCPQRRDPRSHRTSATKSLDREPSECLMLHGILEWHTVAARPAEFGVTWT